MVDVIEVAKKWCQEKDWSLEHYEILVSAFQSCPEGQCSVDVVKKLEEGMDTHEQIRQSRVLVFMIWLTPV